MAPMAPPDNPPPVLFSAAELDEGLMVADADDGLAFNGGGGKVADGDGIGVDEEDGKLADGNDDDDDAADEDALLADVVGDGLVVPAGNDVFWEELLANPPLALEDGSTAVVIRMHQYV